MQGAAIGPPQAPRQQELPQPGLDRRRDTPRQTANIGHHLYLEIERGLAAPVRQYLVERLELYQIIAAAVILYPELCIGQRPEFIEHSILPAPRTIRNPLHPRLQYP
ncbi:hypothetical protein [Asticcacaulis taihuensis]|uniref:hypothetical protein n=1 Tax=Asticcacaulis taihuensis TaxID=260084 RepID=UPI003F7C31F4